jgi:glucoamylase
MAEPISNYLWATGEAAFGAPGISPKWTSSSKDLVGTAYSASSRVWWTTSHGILNEVYFPTIDSPQIRDMELMFTDGETFFHEEKRGFQTEIDLIDPDALALRITCTSPDGKYRIVKDLFSDPHYSTVLMHCRIEGDKEVLKKLRVFALLSPHLAVGGANNSARGVTIGGLKLLVAWKENSALAFGVSGGFKRTSCGFAGKSDGWQDLHKHYNMEWEFPEALNGNLAVTGEIDLSRGHEFLLGIGLGTGLHGALSTLLQSLSTPPREMLSRFIEQWHRVKSSTPLAAMSADKGRLLRLSHAMLLAHEDKTYAGAFIASASIPWGEAKGDEDLGGYHLVWTRDMVQTSTAMLACGKTDTGRRALIYLACSQRSDGGFAQNFWVNGDPYWGGIQLDEVAFPIILCWRLWNAKSLGDFDPLKFVLRAAAFLVRQSPVTQQERWEESAGYSPSTLAAVIAAFICAADIARAHGHTETAAFLEVQADWIESHLEEWTVTNHGTLVPGIKRHYMRVRPPQPGDPYETPESAKQMLHINNRAPGEQEEFLASEVVDAGFLELVRYGIRAADDPIIVDSVKVVDAVLRRETPKGPGWRRYNHDGYGTGKHGEPFLGYGQGGCWPLLGGERAHYELAAGRDVSEMIAQYESFASRGGMMPEQIWDKPDIPEEKLVTGCPSGSAMPLVWAHAEYIKLLRSAADGKVFDLIPVVAKRYLDPKKPKSQYEVFKRRRHISSIAAGKILRIVAGDQFRVVWSTDNWKTKQESDATGVDEAGWYFDIPTEMAKNASSSGNGAGGGKAKNSSAQVSAQVSQIVFTFYWPQTDKWECIDYTVQVLPASKKA